MNLVRILKLGVVIDPSHLISIVISMMVRLGIAPLIEASGGPFSSLPFNYGFQVNVDWFNPMIIHSI